MLGSTMEPNDLMTVRYRRLTVPDYNTAFQNLVLKVPNHIDNAVGKVLNCNLRVGVPA